MSGLGSAARELRRPAALRAIAAAAAVGGLLGLGWGLGGEPEYRSTASAIVVDRGDGVEELGAGASGARLLELARGSEVAQLAAGDLGGDLSGADLLARTEFRLDDDGAVLTIRSTASSPDFAAAAAIAYQGALVELSSILERRRLNRSAARLGDRLAGLEPGTEEAIALEARIGAVEELLAAGPPLRVGRAATLPDEPTSSRPTAVVTAGAALLAALLAALAILAGSLLRGPRPARRSPVLAVLGGEDPVRIGDGGAIELGPVAAAELSALLDRAGLGGDGARAVAVVSASPREGRTSVALGIAASAALRGLAAIVVEADLRAPDLAGRLGVEGAPGLADYLAGEATPREVMRPIRVEGTGSEPGSFVVVCAGSEDVAAEDLIGGPELERLLAKLRRAYDLVLLDTPPLLGGTDGPAVAASAGTAIVSIRPGASDEGEAEEARRLLGDSLSLGSVLLGAERDGADGSEAAPHHEDAGADQPAGSASPP